MLGGSHGKSRRVREEVVPVAGLYLHSALVRLRNLVHSKAGILCLLPVQVLAPQLGAAAMIGQHHLPPPLQLISCGYGLCLRSQERCLR